MKPYSRAAWTDTAPGGSPMGPVSESWIHHTAGPQPKGGVNATVAVEAALIRGTRAYHMSARKMSDIAYSWAVMPSGRCYELRGMRTGGHTYNRNSISLGLVAFGNFDTTKPSPEMLAGFGALISWLKETGKLKGEKHPSGGHRDVGGQFGGTACPGRYLYAQLSDLEGDDMTDDEREALKDMREFLAALLGSMHDGPEKARPKNAAKRIAKVVKEAEAS